MATATIHRFKDVYINNIKADHLIEIRQKGDDMFLVKAFIDIEEPSINNKKIVSFRIESTDGRSVFTSSGHFSYEIMKSHKLETPSIKWILINGYEYDDFDIAQDVYIDHNLLAKKISTFQKLNK